MVDRIWVDGVIRDMTPEEQAEADKVKAEWNSFSEKLKRIKRLRLEKLVETDWWVLRGNMTEEQTAWRKSLRDIPQDYSEDKYDELLDRDASGKLTHSVWSKP